MLMILSPAKSMDMTASSNAYAHTQAEYGEDARVLAEILQQFTPDEIASLMRISDKLAALNVGRYAAWEDETNMENAKSAIDAFSGDVYQSLDASSLDEVARNYLQAHLRILSGMYGVLRPQDLMQAHRLEMGTKLTNTKGKDLYAYWREKVTFALNAYMRDQGIHVLLNLASEEYFKAIDKSRLATPVVTPIFQEQRGGQYKTVAIHAKKARGLMARYAATHDVKNVEDLKLFNEGGYRFMPALSDEARWIFCR